MITSKWISKITDRMETDHWGEPITSFVNEFFVTNLLIKGTIDKYEEFVKPSEDLNQARVRYLEIIGKS